MPAKRSKSKIPFKVFSTDNYSKFASRFPFLKERQIKAKILQAWRKTFEMTDKDIPRKNKQRKKEMSVSEGKSNREERAEGMKLEYSTLRTYSDTRHSRKRKAQDSQTSTTQAPQSSSTSPVHGSIANLDAKNGSNGSPLNQSGKQNELIDLFEEISAEQLLIEPREMGTEDVGSFNHAKWLEKLSQNVREEEKNTGTVSGMFKWRVDRNKNIQQNNSDEKSCESRFLVSNDQEGDSNFLSMFGGEEDIFL